MGVPKFFRYISERYPCLSEFVREYQIPVFDNLYLDMNGIIHMCSHPDDNNPHFRITEEKLFSDIFHYIEVLFRMIKPQKVFFMAVDGVAPRAKMNQQRGRRFRSAKDAEKMENEAKKKGEKLPEAARFDSNCITPGTEFMAKLHEQLKYFVVNKVSTDKMWQKCKVILSGHETPGEGEHKIMDYIRYIRAQPGYDPNTRHCLYGLDADLIMLGLCTHDPHFSLLREEVKFGKKSTKRLNVPEEIRFYLLHLSLMREYLELEFAPLKAKLEESEKFAFDIEKIIDDWVLMGFLVGNDFIPHLPNLHIADGALPKLYKAYMEILPTLDGYINEAGTLNLERFEKFMKELGGMDFEHFEEVRDDLIYIKSKTGRKHTAHPAVSTKCDKKSDEQQDGEDESNFFVQSNRPMDSALAALIKETEEMYLDSSDDTNSDDDDDSDNGDDDDDDNDTTDNDDNIAFKSFKDEYYRNKLEYQKVTPEVMRDQAEGYVRAIQWNLNYYYNGVCSWSWYYPHHYAPYISDIKGFSNLEIKFELGQPFKPYEQLLAVLPAASKSLLPECYHSLMTDDNSLIKEYYPENFQTDLNGKKQEWEAVVLVPFIDEKILLEAMKPCNDQLTEEEIKRNSHGPMLVYIHIEDDLGIYKAPNYFPTISINHAHCTPLYIEDIRIDKEKLVKGAYPGARFDVFYPGFPTMKHLKYKGVLKKVKVKVFEQPSRNENMILSLLPNELYVGDSVPIELLDQNVFVGWPHLIEAKVVAISNPNVKYVFTGDKDKKYSIEDNSGKNSLFKSELEGVTQHYMTRMGVNFGETNVLIHVRVMVGRRYVFTPNGRVNLDKQFSPIVSCFPLQSIVPSIKAYDDCHSTFNDVSDVFPLGSVCFTLSNPHYGSTGTILESTESLKSGNKLNVSLAVVEEPDFTKVQKISDMANCHYINLYNSANQLAISNYVFSRVTGSLFIITKNSEGGLKSVNIGLDLKFNKKNQETPGYTKKIENTWFYTNKAVDLVRTYVEMFPEVFEFLTRNNNVDDLDAEKVFGEDGDEKVKDIQNWLKTLPIQNIERRICNSSVLDSDVVAEIEKAVDDCREKQSVKNIVMQLRPQHLYKPEIQMGNLTPDSLAKTKVFDRVVNVREGFTVPLGLKGTVIAVHKTSSVATDNDKMYDIVFDEPFAGGMALNCSEGKGYRLPVTAFINLSYGRRDLEHKTGKPGALLAQAKANQNMNGFKINPPYINGRHQQNSAFAPVNTQPLSVMSNQYGKNTQFNQYGSLPPFHSQFKPPRRLHSVASAQGPTWQNKSNKEAMNYKSDFMPHYGDKSNKDNLEVCQKNIEAKQQRKNSNSPKKSKTEIDTDCLKKLLKIGDASPKKEITNRNAAQVSTANVQTKIEPSSNQQSIASATARLMSYYQANGLGCPRYTYIDMKQGYYAAQVILPNRKVITGKAATSREETSENAAMEVLKMLNDGQEKVKQVPLSMFPEPPVKWVMPNPQQNRNSTQVYTNRSYQYNQQRQPFYPQEASHSENYKRNAVSGRNMSHSSRGHADPNSSSTSSFVPLQAIMKQGNRSGNNTSKNVNAADPQSRKDDKKAEVKIMSREFVSKGHGLQSAKQAEKSPRKRKTRIAANFVVDKS